MIDTQNNQTWSNKVKQEEKKQTRIVQQTCAQIDTNEHPNQIRDASLCLDMFVVKACFSFLFLLTHYSRMHALFTLIYLHTYLFEYICVYKYIYILWCPMYQISSFIHKRANARARRRFCARTCLQVNARTSTCAHAQTRAIHL